VNIGKIDFGDKKAVSELIDDFCEKYAYADIEHVLIISPNGNYFTIAGTKISVDTSIIEEDNLTGSICVHNHPVPKGKDMGDSFSKYDLGFSAEYKTGTQYLVSGKRYDSFNYAGNLNRDKIELEYKKAFNILREQAINGEIDIKQEQEQIMQILNDILEGFLYEKL